MILFVVFWYCIHCIRRWYSICKSKKPFFQKKIYFLNFLKPKKLKNFYTGYFLKKIFLKMQHSGFLIVAVHLHWNTMVFIFKIWRIAIEPLWRFITFQKKKLKNLVFLGKKWIFLIHRTATGLIVEEVYR